MTHVRGEDIVDRVSWRKRHWFHGDPKISLEGTNGFFGFLSLDFGDEIIRWRIYIDDRDGILDVVNHTITNWKSWSR